MEACGFWPAFREVVEPEVRRLVLVHPQRMKAIASAKLKNDRGDSGTLGAPVTDLFGRRGRQWLAQVKLPTRCAVASRDKARPGWAGSWWRQHR